MVYNSGTKLYNEYSPSASKSLTLVFAKIFTHSRAIRMLIKFDEPRSKYLQWQLLN